MKLLVVGSGLIGAQRIQALTKLTTVSEITVFDPKVSEGTKLSAKATAVSENTALAKKYDAAVVATPHDTAVELLPRIFPLAPAILVEKPLGRTSVETENLIAAAKQSNSRVFVGLNYRFLKNVRHLRKLLSSDEYGRVLGVDAVLSHGGQPGYEKSWKTDPIRCGGGVCIDPGIHLFDLFQWMFGGVELAAGHLSRQFWQIQVEDHASLVLTLPGGAAANIYLSLSSWQSRMEITVETERAQFLLRGRGKFYGAQRLTIVTKWPWLQPDQPRETLFDYGMEDVSLQQETEEFTTACTNPNANLTIATADDALRSMQIVDACYSKLSKTY
ncbi:MAG TPA: Gfo/Idh/MocA family oxidoreductase [Candidatus Acidoferrales bacterium]|jgi:predicted dehydrogenase|nr:Gfo/Idh/MocA family oxidoreductase [Candidatus Acidoferrales bacterium]